MLKFHNTIRLFLPKSGRLDPKFQYGQKSVKYGLDLLGNYANGNFQPKAQKYHNSLENLTCVQHSMVFSDKRDRSSVHATHADH